MLLIVTSGKIVVEYVLSDGTGAPNGAIGLVGPKPVPHRIITSPGFAGMVVVPEKVPFLTAQLKSWRVATGWPLRHSKNAGPYWFDGTVNVGLVPPGVVTVNGKGPNPTSGASRLI